MKTLSPKLLDLLWHDPEPRELRLREIISERLAAKPPPAVDDAIVASYFFAFRTLRLGEAVGEIAYHATSGVKHPPPGSLLEACTGKTRRLRCVRQNQSHRPVARRVSPENDAPARRASYLL